jgi:hypothetical protein
VSINQGEVHCVRSLFLAVVLGLPAAYLVLIAVGAWQSGLTWREMDLNGDGRTSLTEVFSVSDTGTRSVVVGGRACTEVFLLKDGLPVKVTCPAG